MQCLLLTRTFTVKRLSPVNTVKILSPVNTQGFAWKFFYAPCKIFIDWLSVCWCCGLLRCEEPAYGCGRSKGKTCLWVLSSVVLSAWLIRTVTVLDVAVGVDGTFGGDGVSPPSCPQTHTDTHTHTCMHAHLHAHTHTHTHTCMHACTHTHVHTHTQIQTGQLFTTLRAQELCESWGGCPGVPISNISSLYSLCGCKATVNSNYLQPKLEKIINRGLRKRIVAVPEGKAWWVYYLGKRNVWRLGLTCKVFVSFWLNSGLPVPMHCFPFSFWPVQFTRSDLHARKGLAQCHLAGRSSPRTSEAPTCELVQQCPPSSTTLGNAGTDPPSTYSTAVCLSTCTITHPAVPVRPLEPWYSDLPPVPWPVTMPVQSPLSFSWQSPSPGLHGIIV